MNKIQILKTFAMPILKAKYVMLSVFCLLGMVVHSQVPSFEWNKTANNVGVLAIEGNAANVIIGSRSSTLAVPDLIGSSTQGFANILIGFDAGQALSSGGQNTIIGIGAGESITTANSNTIIGLNAGKNVSGDGNVILGLNAGLGFNGQGAGSGNVLIGRRAGAFEFGDNQLYISNDNRSAALIRGDFALETVTINGDLTVADILQLRSTNADPGCTVNADIGKLWMGTANGSNGNRTLRVCRGTLGWQDLF